MRTLLYKELDSVEIANPALALLVSRSVGPPILRLRLTGRENLFAELPDFAAEFNLG